MTTPAPTWRCRCGWVNPHDAAHCGHCARPRVSDPRKVDMVDALMRLRAAGAAQHGKGRRTQEILGGIEALAARIGDAASLAPGGGRDAAWIDLALAALDGAMRDGFGAAEIVHAIAARAHEPNNRTGD